MFAILVYEERVLVRRIVEIEVAVAKGVGWMDGFGLGRLGQERRMTITESASRHINIEQFLILKL